MLGGAFMAFSVAFMWIVSRSQLWFTPPPAAVAGRTGIDARPIA
jgi:hypothetical protein